MLASQAAAGWFLHRHRFGDASTFFRLIPMEDRLSHLAPDERAACLERMEDGIDYQVLGHASQLDDTTPLYWGDLLHMRHYLESIRGLLRRTSSTPEDLLLLASSPLALVARTVSFGTTLLYHSASDLTDATYGPLLSRFLTNARLVMPRDMVSLAHLAAVVPHGPVIPGLDATQLFCGGLDWRAAFPEGTDRSLANPGGLLCYFARGKHDLADLRHAIGLFSKGFGKPVCWLPWGDSLSFPHVGEYEGRLELEDLAAGRQPRLSALLEALSAATCVLTDTYHVAVIAWSLGTPAMIVCGDHWPHDYNAVVDKRYVFCLQHGLQEFFINNARDHGRLAAFVRRAVDLVAEGKVLEWYRLSVSQRAEVCEKRLVEAIGEGLDCA
jgi:Polysaccharide pyruvyl transferase